MLNIRILIVLVVLIYLSSCTEPYDLFTGNAEVRLVVDGLITNEPGPYYVGVSYSLKELPINRDPYNYGIIGYEPVEDAIVVISDDAGNIDTLESLKNDIVVVDDLWPYRLERKPDGTVDSIPIGVTEASFHTYGGYYRTRHIQGVPNRTYSLYVKVAGNEYRAESYMQEVPEIDTARQIRTTEGEDFESFFALFFNEDTVHKNYYLVDVSQPQYYPYHLGHYAVYDDVLLDSYVNGLYTSPLIYHDISGMTMTVRLSSLDKNAYQFYKASLKQYNDDGGIYSQAPATPPTNISGNALGIFRASAVNKMEIHFEDNYPMK